MLRVTTSEASGERKPTYPCLMVNSQGDVFYVQSRYNGVNLTNGSFWHEGKRPGPDFESGRFELFDGAITMENA